MSTNLPLAVRRGLVATAAGALLCSGFALHLAWAQQAGIRRTDLQRHDLGVPGREVVQVRVDLDPGLAFGNHTHPGEEIINVLEGTLEYQIEGKPPVTLKAGDVLFIPAGTVHAAKTSAAATPVTLPPISSKRASHSSHL
jgi:quercetin dioxygenase-like cupin family protein